MPGPCRAFSWFFDVSDPRDPKLGGWLHPSFALTVNLGLAFAVAFAAFLAAPLWFQQEWLRQQPPAVAHFVQHLAVLTNSVGIQPLSALHWIRDTLGPALLPDRALFDKKQAFALYSWERGSLGPQSLAMFLLVYVVLMLSCRLYEKGPVMLYDAAWACNMSMVLTAMGAWTSNKLCLKLVPSGTET